jgi:hypothetical protein
LTWVSVPTFSPEPIIYLEPFDEVQNDRSFNPVSVYILIAILFIMNIITIGCMCYDRLPCFTKNRIDDGEPVTPLTPGTEEIQREEEFFKFEEEENPNEDVFVLESLSEDSIILQSSEPPTLPPSLPSEDLDEVPKLTKTRGHYRSDAMHSDSLPKKNVQHTFAGHSEDPLLAHRKKQEPKSLRFESTTSKRKRRPDPAPPPPPPTNKLFQDDNLDAEEFRRKMLDND